MGCTGMSTKSPLDSVSTELSARRTGMSFQRTRLSADRTLMSVIRTSLSMIGFGFTIFQFFQKLKAAGTLPTDRAPRSFGLALVYLGVGILMLGIVYHLLFMHGLRQERAQLIEAQMVHGESGFPISFTLTVAVLLLTFGLLAIISMVFEVGPFG